MRNRTHILEEESQFELKRILPTEWVFREKPKDYGIDIEIEVFSSDGKYTGIVFWIQLKGTDSTDIRDHKSIRMPIDKIKQLSSYELPVAIFRYNSMNRTFYFEWISRYLFLSSSSNKKSFNIEFEGHHLWNKDSTNQILSFLRRNNKFNNNSFSFPIKGFINNINAPNKTARILSAEISKNITLIDLVRDRYLADIEINLLENRTVLNLSGAFGSSIGYNKEHNEDDELIYNAFKKSLLLLLFQIDKDVELFKFINENELLEDVINHQEILQYLMPKLIASDSGIHFTKEIVEHVFKSGDTITSSMIQMILFLSSKNIISQERIESYFNQIISISLESKNETSLATTYYNFGGYYRGINIFDKALHYYNKAFKKDNSFLKRAYFCYELGGILFELDSFRLSAKFYKKANELEPENIYLLATLGDAHFYSGNYEIALNLFDEFLLKNINSEHDKHEFSLKFTICNFLIEFLDTKNQKRDVKKSFDILNSYSNEDLIDFDKLNQLIKIDALNPYVWNYYSLHYLKAQDSTMIFISSLMLAILTKNNSKMWAYLSILTTYEDTTAGLLCDIVNTAYFYCREDFISELQKMVDLEEYDNFKGEEFLNYVEELIKTPKELKTVLRFWNNDDFKIIEIN